MSAPTDASWMALKRLCRYLVGLPRMIFLYRWQDVDAVDIYTDTDWAGCPKTRKSTSGGCVMLGAHTIKSWSSTQTSTALSSAEAEFYGVVRGSGIGLGFQSLLRDLGIALPLRVWTDSSAAVGICSRQGLGKVRHLETHTLWVQQAVRSKRIDLRKIDGERNPADIFTKHSISRERLIMLTQLYDCRYSGGRAASAPRMRTTPGSKVTMAEAHAVGEAYTDREDESEGETPAPIMPHKKYEPMVLRDLYPPLEVIEAIDANDPTIEGPDYLADEGDKVIEKIIGEAQQYGRRRRRVDLQDG